eukprot:6752238-Prymnesium_polylepis.1
MDPHPPDARHGGRTLARGLSARTIQPQPHQARGRHRHRSYLHPAHRALAKRYMYGMHGVVRGRHG